MTRRERILYTLTFWLRPDFVLRVIGRFQRIAGFDRAIGLASSGFTAVVAASVLLATTLPWFDVDDVAAGLIARFDLSGAGADAVREVFAANPDSEAGFGLFGTLLLLLAVLSFTRAAQRLFEAVWELPALSVRNTVGGLKWVAGMIVTGVVLQLIRAIGDQAVLQLFELVLIVPLIGLATAWSMRVLTAERIAWRDTLPTAVVVACLLTAFSIAAGVYVPRLFASYADRYGVIGAVLAIISWLFGLMTTLVGATALGREVSEELRRLAAGIRPSDDEVRTQWDAIISEARSRYGQVREWIDRRRGGGEPPTPPAD